MLCIRNSGSTAYTHVVSSNSSVFAKYQSKQPDQCPAKRRMVVYLMKEILVTDTWGFLSTNPHAVCTWYSLSSRNNPSNSRYLTPCASTNGESAVSNGNDPKKSTRNQPVKYVYETTHGSSTNFDSNSSSSKNGAKKFPSTSKQKHKSTNRRNPSKVDSNCSFFCKSKLFTILKSCSYRNAGMSE